jgi:hypothetical protein
MLGVRLWGNALGVLRVRRLGGNVAEAAAGKEKIPKVFISYSHDSKAHEDRVLVLADRLMADGIDCELDQYVESPDEGWILWMTKGIEKSDFILVICTKKYHDKVMEKGKSGEGRGVKYEGAIIRMHIYNAYMKNKKFIPVLFNKSDSKNIPIDIGDVTSYCVDTDEGYDKLFGRLSGQPLATKPEPGKLRKLDRKVRKTSFVPWNIPQRNDFFTGRQDILETLTSTLDTNGVSAITQTQVVSGLGGIGKTQTAIEYACRYRDKYNAAFWVVADTEESIYSGFVAIAEILDLPEKAAQDQKEIVSAVKRWCQENGGWLLILDNVDDQNMAHRFIPQGAGGHVIITSRKWAFDKIGITDPVVLDEMKPNEAEVFFINRTAREGIDGDELQAVKELAKELGYLPLALEQAGAYIFKKQSWFRNYIEKYRKIGVGVKLLEREKPVTGDYPLSVLTTWEMNFKTVEELSPASADILRVCAFYNSDAIPLEIFSKGAAELGDNISKVLSGDQLEMDEVLKPIADYSLIQRNIYAKTFNIHRLVQSVVRYRINDEAEQWAQRAVMALDAANPYGNSDYKQWKRCIKHVDSLKATIDKSGFNSDGIIRLKKRMGNYIEAIHRTLPAITLKGEFRN